jgi:hypothetical protein
MIFGDDMGMEKAVRGVGGSLGVCSGCYMEELIQGEEMYFRSF